jgi:hypothetical protein
VALHKENLRLRHSLFLFLSILRLNAYEVIGINFVEPFWGVLGQRKPTAASQPVLLFSYHLQKRAFDAA